MNSKQKQIFTSYPTKNSNTKKISIEIKTSAVYVDRIEIVFFELPQNLENVPSSIINPLTCKRRLR